MGYSARDLPESPKGSGSKRTDTVRVIPTPGTGPQEYSGKASQNQGTN